MRQVSLLVKPASSLCDLRCAYCFYHADAAARSVYSYGIMGPAVARKLVRRAFESAEEGVAFAFQGGEPTLAGLDFFREFADAADKYNIRGLPVSYALQTNGLSIDAGWADFLAERRFLVGISLDGDRPIHDAARKDAAGRGSFDRVMGTVDLLRKRAVDFNILCVVRDETARRFDELWRFFADQGLEDLQFIPCVDPPSGPGGRRRGAPAQGAPGLSAAGYSAFLQKAFDAYCGAWKADRPARVRLFDNLVGMAMGMPPEACGLAGLCGGCLVVEADGGVYPCDFYAGDEWRLGSILERSLDELAASPRRRIFLDRARTLPGRCAGCGQLGICGGGCMRDRETGEGDPGENRFCGVYRDFLARNKPRLDKLAARIVKGKGAE